MKKFSVFTVFLFFCMMNGSALGQQQRYQYNYDPSEDDSSPSSSYPDSSYQYDPNSGTQSGYDGTSDQYPSSSSYDRSRGTRSAGLPDPYNKYYIEINGNSSTFEGRCGYRMPILPNSIFFGLGGLTSDEDFYLIGIEAAYGNRLLDEKLNLDIGMKGVWGEAENDIFSKNIGAFTLMMRAEYDLPDIEISYERYIDLDMFGELSMAPEPLTFADGASFLESRIGISINLAQNKSSAILLGYRYVRMEFEDGEDWEKSDGSGYIGFLIRF